ncbi:MAG: glycosyl hydrolase family 28-related protein, partial [Verrucomicrobia bacterium]|nr:glycosyl hydrolase family 28-related protein [Verrucomicrobiota bacterium]
MICRPKMRPGLLIITLAVCVALQGVAASHSVDAKVDFGAVGDGMADDTAALQRALNYLSTNLVADAGVCLYLPAGTYKITNQLAFASTNPVNWDGQGITIRGNGRDDPNASIIYSTATNGALLFNINDNAGRYNFKVQLQDLRIKAGVANAGAAIEIAKLTGTNILLQTTPWLRNVEITRANTNCYFTYGFKGNGIVRPIFDQMKITGNLPGMVAGIYLDYHYGYDVSRSFFSDADVAIDSRLGGEGNSTTWTTITNVNIGVRMNVEAAVVSSSGGGAIHCNISARQIGIIIDKKSFAGIHNNVFSGGPGPCTNIYATELSQSTISDNTFIGGTNQYGVVLTEDRVGTDNRDTIAYNQFGPFATSVFVDTNVSLTKIIDNAHIQTNIVDRGISTYIVHGAMRPPYDSPAAHDTGEDLRWSTTAFAPILNVTSYGAKGDGVTDDTTAITNAAAQFKAALNSSGQGTLYFPAGRYKLSKQIVVSQSGSNWQRMTICGDGSQVSTIEVTSTNGVFKITCTNQVPTRIHNLGLDATQTNTATAIEVTQQNGTNNGARSLIMHDVVISANGNVPYFKTAFVCQGLVRPLFQNNWTELRDFVGATGMTVTGGYGFDWQGGRFGQVDTACTINSLGGAVNIRGPNFCSGNIETGLAVNAGGGTFALERAHINARNNLVVSNASEASFIGTETLWSSFYSNTVSSTLRFVNCTNIYVRDNCLFAASGMTRPLNNFVTLDGNKNRNADISGNMLRFVDYEGTGFNIAASSSNVAIYDNRFFTFPAVDITNAEPTAAIALLPMEYRPELVGYWDMEEGSNTLVFGRNYLQHGTISGATWITGKYGTGLDFNGTNNTVATLTPQFADLATNFTLMFWVKPTKAITGGAQSGGQSYAISGGSPVTNASHVAVMLSVGTNGIKVVEYGPTNGTPDIATVIDWAGTISPTAWTHVAVTYSNSVPRLYVGGVLTATGSVSVGKIPHPGGSVWGGNAWGWFKGALDEIRVLDFPLNATEIAVEANGAICDFNGSQVTAGAFSTVADWDGGGFPVDNLIANLARFNKTSYANQPNDLNYALNCLIFGDGVTATADTTITISGGGGQQLQLGAGGIAMNANAGNATINRIQLGADQSWINHSTSILSVGTLGNFTTDTPFTLTLAGAGPINITGVISDNLGAGTTALVIAGATVALNGNNTHTGPTEVRAGTLLVNGSQSASAILATNTGSILGGDGNIGSPVTVADGAILAPGSTGGSSIATLTLSNAPALQGTLLLELNRSSSPANSDRLVIIAEPFTFGGTLTVTNSGIALQPGDTFTLFTATNYTGAFAATNLPPLPGWMFWDTSKLNVDGFITVGQPSPCIWHGDGATNNWELGGNTNWLLNSQAVAFSNGANVVFDDTSTNLTVTLTATVAPTNVLFSSSNSYTFAGAGVIAGSCGLTKSGAGQLTLNTTNTFTGGVTLNAGTVKLGNANCLGTGALLGNGGGFSFSGSNLRDGNGGKGVTNDIALLKNTSGNTLQSKIQLSGQISGPGNLSMNGFSSGELTLSGNNSAWSGNAGAGVTNNFVIATAADSLTVQLTSNLKLSGVISGDGSVVKSGTNTLTLAGANTYTNTTTVTAGTLLVNGSLASGAVNISSNAILGGSGAIAGIVTVTNGATLAPGNSLGTLILSNTPVLQGTVLMQLNKTNAPATNDQIIVVGQPLNYGGTLTVTLTATVAPT